MSPTRRQIIRASTGGITAFAGCSALSDPRQALLIAVNNYSESPHRGYVRLKKNGREVVRQYLEIGAAEPDGWTTVETEISLGGLSRGTRLTVTASFGEDLEEHGSITLNCPDEYDGEGIYVQIDAGLDLRLNEWCYDEFPSGEARQGEISGS